MRPARWGRIPSSIGRWTLRSSAPQCTATLIVAGAIPPSPSSEGRGDATFSRCAHASIRRAGGEIPSGSKTLQQPTGVAMTRLSALCLALLAAHAWAGQEWELVSVTRGAGWEVNQAHGVLKQ